MVARYNANEAADIASYLRELTLRQGGNPVRETADGALCVLETEVKARSAPYTVVVDDGDERGYSHPTISTKELIRLQDAAMQHVAETEAELVTLDGAIGNMPDHKVGTRLRVEAEYANLAAMQQSLWFPPPLPGGRLRPELAVMYLPSFSDPRVKERQPLIAIDLAHGSTWVFGSGYFGEAKMGGLRMWDALQYRKGNLALHAGLKRIRTKSGAIKHVLIIGLSGTGKTTTTFSRQGTESWPMQDDFVALLPGGYAIGTENGSFAKVHGIDEESEPAIWHGVHQRGTYLENVPLSEDGTPDFENCHPNARAVIRAADIPGMIPTGVEQVDAILILNRDDSIIPGVARMRSAEQAAAYFMLGESTGTSAGGKGEEGRKMRVPGTNPFFLYRLGHMANRFYELISGTDIDVYVLNTGVVGGAFAAALDITPEVTGAIVEGIVEDEIGWKTDADFGYDVARYVPNVTEVGILQPLTYYRHNGIAEGYDARVASLREDRRRFLSEFPELAREIREAI